MAITALLDSPFYHGTAGISSLVPYPYDVAIAGRPYPVDFEFTPFRREAYRHISIDITRTQADTDGVPGEHTLNPAGLWRRSQQTWGHGAGQAFLDRSTSDPERFRTSKGIDPWTPYQFSLLNDVSLNYTSAGTNIQMATTGDYLWFIDGTHLYYTTDPTANPMSTSDGAVGTAYGLASDGYNAWAVTSSGIWTGYDGTPTPTEYITHAFGAGSVIGYALGRLMVGDGASMYNITANSLPAALLTHPNPGWQWVGFAEGAGFIYAAGKAGSHSAVYQITIQPDGTALSSPSVSVTMPAGEVITSIKGYLGFILIGTNLGVRVATTPTTTTSPAGILTLGALITPAPAIGSNQPTAMPGSVLCFEGQDRFAWYGYTNYDGVSTGLGRIDLSTLNALTSAPGVPGWASDLMYTGQGAVTSVTSWVGRRVFAVAGHGIVVEDPTNVVSSGSITTGGIAYDVSDLKYAVFIDVLPAPNAGTIATAISIDGGGFIPCGSQTVTMTNPGLTSRLEYTTPQTPCNLLEVQYTLSGSLPQPNVVAVHRTTLRSMVATRSATQFKIPLRLSPMELVEDIPIWFDPDAEREFLEGLRLDRAITTFQENQSLYAVTIDNLDWTPDRLTKPLAPRNAGVLVVTMTTIT